MAGGNAVIGALRVDLGMDTGQYEDGTRRAAKTTAEMKKSFEQLRSSTQLLTRALGAIVGVQSLQAFQQLTDSAIKMENSLKVAGLAGSDLKKVYDQLYVSAQKNAAPLEGMVSLYSKLSLVQNQLGIDSAQIVKFVDNIGISLRVGGVSAEEASGALLQLSQALGGSVVRAEEFNSIAEGAPTILQAAALGISEAGGEVSKLRKIMLDGHLSAKTFFDGVQAGSGVMEQRLAGASDTAGQAFQRLRNALVVTAGKLNDGSGSTKELVDAIDKLSRYIQNTDFSPFIRGLVRMAESIAGTIAGVSELADKLGKLSGAQKLMGAVRDGSYFENLSKAIQAEGDYANALQTTERAALQLGKNYPRQPAIENTELRGREGMMGRPAPLKPVSIKDNPVESDDDDAKAAKAAARAAAKEEREREAAQSRLEFLKESLMTEEESELASYQKRLSQLMEFENQKVVGTQEANDMRLRIEREHQANLKEMWADQLAAYGTTLGSIGDMMGSLSTIMGREGDKQLAVTKALSIAQALINTYTGITKALTLPFPASLAAAAQVAAQGFAAVAGIRSTSKGSSGGRSVSGGSSGSGGEVAPAAQGASQQTLYVQGIDRASLYSGDAVRQIAESLIKYQADGGKVVLA